MDQFIGNYLGVCLCVLVTIFTVGIAAGLGWALYNLFTNKF